MSIKDEIWDLISEDFLNEYQVIKPGPKPTHPRLIMDGIIWILRTGAQWNELPDKFPPYQTVHRWFQRWVEDGKLDRALKKIAQYLKDKKILDLSECFIDATFAGAKKGAYVLDLLRKGRELKSWQLQIALVFQSPCILKAPLLTRRNWLKGPLITVSSMNNREY